MEVRATVNPSSYQCPYCRTRDVQGMTQCPRCGGDLRLLACLHSRPDIWFNRALDLLDANDLEAAAELLCACCVARPQDAEARFVLGRVRAQQGQWDAARRCANIVRDLDPKQAGLGPLQARIEARDRG